MRKLVISGFAALALLSAPAFAQTAQTPQAPAKAPPTAAPTSPAKPAAPHSQPAGSKPVESKPAGTKPETQLLDINSATKEQLEALKGIGPARAEAIIKGRPYRGKDELLRKKILPQNVYDDVKDGIIARQH